jgi:hypothetical protein
MAVKLIASSECAAAEGTCYRKYCQPTEENEKKLYNEKISGGRSI